MKRFAALLLAALGLAAPAWALDDPPQEQAYPGLRTWTLEADKPLLKLEDAMAALRSSDRMTYEKAMRDLGLPQESDARGHRAWPRLAQPVRATAQFLGRERRKMAILSAPVLGRHRWLAVLLRQEGRGENAWRARQVFVFDTDPAPGLGQAFPDVLGDGARFWQVEHFVPKGYRAQAHVTSLLRWDERGRMRLCFQESSDYYRSGKLQGQALRLTHKLAFKGDQQVRRRVTLKTWPWMRREDFDRYERPGHAVKPSKQEELEESFAWDPVQFDFYGPEQELGKLVNAPAPYLRAEAAKRLGERLKTAPAQMAQAAWKDPDQGVRIQVALALAAIGDRSALASLAKALDNQELADEERQALEQARAALKARPR